MWQAIARLVELLGNASEHVMVIGGLVPSMLAADPPATPIHWGTRDVDLLLVTDPDSDLSGLEAAIKEARFAPSPGKSGWQWGGRLEGQELILEIVCDIDGRGVAESVPLKGCRDLRAGNFRGPRFAALDRIEIPIALSGRTVHVPSTGLAGYLFAKAHALVARKLDKDFYDFVYVALHSSAGNPTELAAAVRASPLGAHIDATHALWVQLGDHFRDANQPAPRHYAHYAALANPEHSSRDQLAQDAVAGVGQFLRALFELNDSQS